MEENKINENGKPSYEQLEMIAQNLQRQLIMAERTLRSIDMDSIKLNWLFKVLENRDSFTEKFTTDCALEITNMLKAYSNTENKKEVSDNNEGE